MLSVTRVGLASKKEKRSDGERGAGPRVSYEREDQMRGDNCFNALLLLYKSALRAGRKDFLMRYRENQGKRNEGKKR